MLYEFIQRALDFANLSSQAEAISRIKGTGGVGWDSVTNWVHAPHFLAAVALPLAVSVLVLGARSLTPHEKFNLDVTQFLAATLLSIPLTEVVYAAGINGYLTLTVFPLYPILLLKEEFINKQTLPSTQTAIVEPPFRTVYGALLIYPITFFTSLFADIVCALDIGFPLRAVGGGGLNDGLILYPLGAVLLAIAAQRLAVGVAARRTSTEAGAPNDH